MPLNAITHRFPILPIAPSEASLPAPVAAALRILVDAAVMAREFVVMSAGVRETKLLLAPAVLQRLPGVEVAELTLPVAEAG